MKGTQLARRENQGMLEADTKEGWDLVVRKATGLAKSSVIPEDYRGKPENVLVAMEMAQRTGIPVLAVMQNLYVIHGKPSWSAQFLIMAVNRSGRFSPLRFRFEGTEGRDDWGCRAVATDLEADEELIGPLVTIDMAKKEGWYQKKGSKWQTMPELMLRYRSAAFWARVYSPELSVGLHTVDEVEDIPPSPAHQAQKVQDALRQEDPPTVAGEPINGHPPSEVPDHEIVGEDEEPAEEAAAQSGLEL